MPDFVYQRLSASEVKWHLGQVNCIIGRDDQERFTMFNTIGHALHLGHAINTASAASLGLHPIHPAGSCDFAPVGNSRPACSHPMWHRRTVTVAAAYTGGSPCDDGAQQ